MFRILPDFSQRCDLIDKKLFTSLLVRFADSRGGVVHFTDITAGITNPHRITGNRKPVMQRVQRAELGTRYQPASHRHRYCAIALPPRITIGITRSANRATLIPVAYGNLHYGLAVTPSALPTDIAPLGVPGRAS